MINVDTVYQKVLTLANREQRGYITPQEFNLLADKAQLDVLNSYFHDIKTAYIKPKNQTGFGDELEMLSEKLQPFRSSTTLTSDGSSATLTLPTTLYKIDTISRPEGEIVELSKKEILLTENNPLTKATVNRTVYVREAGDTVTLYPTPSPSQGQTISFEIQFFKKPALPNWGYVVVSDKALYNSSTSTNFELHASEEETLVGRILELAGIAINRPDLHQSAMVDKQSIKQEQNN
tara:strand:+ start:558 stop:1262 length:705 start_codon:yes stop_codon:yes gene_type:complete